MFILKKGHQPGVYVPLRALFLVLESSYVDTRQTTHQKTFIFDHLVPCSVVFDSSATSDMWVHARGWG